MNTNRAGLVLIKEFEGLRTTAYIDPVGILTIGYGHTNAAGPPTVTKGMKITALQAEGILMADLVKYEAAVLKTLKRVPNENQFSAMVSLCFNIGPGAFAGSSVARRFNEGNIGASADAFRMWNKGTDEGKKVVLPGLTRRREAERLLFLTPVKAITGPQPSLPSTTDAPPPEKPATDAPTPAQPPSIQKVMIYLIGAAIAIIAAWFGFGGK
jgi:lysozyme